MPPSPPLVPNSLYSLLFSRDSDLTSSFWDVDILKLGCGYTKQRCGYTTNQIDSKDVDILHKGCGYTTNIRKKDINSLLG